jgi:pyruvate dehydrogenase E1 component alpha subunit
MFLIRSAEQAMVEFYRENKIFSFVHFYIGQEAIAVGVSANLRLQDRVFGNHRSHGHYLAQGGDLFAMLSELYGKATGCCGGRGGSMHLIDRNAGFLGAVPIVGSTLSIAVGFAWAAKLLKSGATTAVFFGEGATEEGAFSESLNLACLHKLPILFICEDNGFSVYTDIEKRRPSSFRFEEYFKGHGVDFEETDGMDVQRVFESTKSAIARLHQKNLPQVLYFKTWRYLEHCGPDPDDHLDYRSAEEIEAWKKKDPLFITSQSLKEKMSQFDIWHSNCVAEIRSEIDSVVEQVRSAANPVSETLQDNLWAKAV